MGLNRVTEQKTWAFEAGKLNQGTYPLFTIPAKSIVKHVYAVVEETIEALAAKDITSINLTSNVITIANHGFASGTPVQLTTTDTEPGGISLLTTYYVKLLTANTFTLSASIGGANVDITSAGTGTHTLTPIDIVATVGDEDDADGYLLDTFSGTLGMAAAAMEGDYLASGINKYCATETAINMYLTGQAKKGNITFVVEFIRL